MTASDVPATGTELPGAVATDRGFTVYTCFADTYGAAVRVQASSSVEPRVWICAQGGGTVGADEGDTAAHLSVDQARWVRDALSAFIAESEAPR